MVEPDQKRLSEIDAIPGELVPPKGILASARVLERDRIRICQEIDAYVKKTGIKYVPIEILKAIVHNQPLG